MSETHLVETWLDAAPPGAPAIVDGAGAVARTYGDLRAEAQRWRDQLAADRKRLVFVLADRNADVVAAILGGWLAGHAVALLDPALPVDAVEGMTAAFTPEAVIAPDGSWPGWGASLGGDVPLHDDLALLLATSGSTGRPKLVRLSRRAVASNAQAVAKALGIGASARASLSLPISYSYGLSVLTSHLASGAAVCIPAGHPRSPRFWAGLARQQCTSFAAVPDTYRSLAADGFRALLGVPSLALCTQAGGRLEAEVVAEAARALADFRPMYGQTEATARITCTRPGEARERPSSVGVAVPGTTVSVDEAGGEVVVKGPGVMMGYAETRRDLALGDLLDGVLRTGDLGRIEADGSLTITGRSARFVKILGKRVGLDDVEAAFGPGERVAAVLSGDSEQVVVFGTSGEADLAARRAIACRALGAPLDAVRVHPVDRLPMNVNGKVDYGALRSAGAS